MSASPANPSGSALAPLRHRVFAVLWTATVIGNVGTWMRDVASGWLMTSLAPSPLMVALVQAAATLPVFLLALPAGALADLLDRRRLLIWVQVLLGAVSLTLAVVTLLGLMTPWLLIILVLMGGVGAALAAPAWQSSVPEMVPRADLGAAVALNSMGINVSRAIGPALGGLILATLGVAATYLVDALSYVIVIAALLWWRRQAPVVEGPRETLPGAMRAGLRYAANSAPLRRVLLRSAVFVLFGAAHWALLPLLARHVLGGGPALYGVMLAAIGAGAVGGALALPWLRRRLGGAEGLMLAGALGSAAAQAGLAVIPSEAAAVLLCLLAGAAWIAVLTTVNTTAQSVLPNWVRARGLALYLTVFAGGMTLGSLAWGQVASFTSVPTALLLAAALGTAAALAMRRLPLPAGSESLDPSHHWAAPEALMPMAPERGPVAVQIVYRVAPERQDAFRAAIAPLGATRRRDGALAWAVFADTEAPERVVEWFVVASWAEHLRQHHRVTVADQALQATVTALHEGTEPPRVTHLVAL
ncbi:MFS transporter [Roseococcus suduntuyensis]|uniref:MFS family permease n=1 Tax=Roseococcus suduntuyensis TaxID=455361 RepID=A0A840AGP6_9PROT|nr:MFS transporter [Roseococcus suduntuyensis]MBB3899255.1 MFS family permease [Roseococcus suduntuyensis]